VSLSDQELLAYLLVGIGRDIFQEISQDLGRLPEDQLTFESTIVCIRNRLLMQKVNSTVGDQQSDSHHHSQMEISSANLVARNSDQQRARHKANKRKFNLRNKSLFKASNGNLQAEYSSPSRYQQIQGNFPNSKRFRLSSDVNANGNKFNREILSCLACGKRGHNWNKCWNSNLKNLFMKKNRH